jgi:uncharacterized repeat protein (TIGR04138 family)
MSHATRRPDDLLRDLVARDPRYRPDAYRFIFEALDYTLKAQGRKGGHVSGRELLEGIRDFALDQFGGLAGLVFDQWGVRCTGDFGEMVFNLVEAGLMGKTESDSREDFRDVYAFRDVFRVDARAPQKSRPVAE